MVLVLNVGSSRPSVQVTQSTVGVAGTVQTIQYLDVGTVLTITPTINQDGYVNMIVDQTDNSATNEVEFDAPVLSKREVTTNVLVFNGQTTVLGGLAGDTKSTTITGIPYLMNLPFIGGIFRNTNVTTETTELFLFLTPHVIFTDQDTDKLLNAVKNGTVLMQQVDPGPHFAPRADTVQMQTTPIRARTDTTIKSTTVPPTRRDTLR